MPLFAIDTFRAAKPSRYPFSVATPATDLPLELPSQLGEVQAAYDQLQKEGVANGLKRAYINLSALLSGTLQQDILSVYTDDDGSDFACLSEQGAPVSLIARCGEFVVKLDREGKVNLTREPNGQQLHALASAHLQMVFGITGQSLGFGSFDPPENLGFMELATDA